VHAEDRALRRIDDRGREHRAEHAAVGDRERAARELLDGDLPSFARLPKSAIADSICAIDIWSALRRIGTTSPRSLPDRDADVVVAVVDDVGSVDGGVHDRILAQRVHHRFHEEGHEAELHAVILLEAVLVAGAQLHHRRHVHLVERSEYGRGGLGLDQALGNALAEARHGDALFAARTGGWRGLRRGGGLRIGHIGFRNPAVPTCSGNRRRVDALLGGDLGGGRGRCA
jgi:hypothetical protein